MDQDNGYPKPFCGLAYAELDADLIYQDYFRQLMTFVFSIVKFDNIPSTVNETFFKYCIFANGKVTFFKDDSGTLLALNGRYTERPDIYYIPEKMIINNPRLDQSYIRTIGEDCAVVYCRECDKYTISWRGGLYMLIAKTATLLTDNVLSINIAQKNTRLINIMSADDEMTKRSIDEVMASQYSGKPYKAVLSSIIGNVKSVPLTPSAASNNYLVELIQLEQYILSHFYEKIGLCTHDQMKRERLITSEINDNIDLAEFNIDNIIDSITDGLNQVNAMFDTNITCYLNPIIVQQRADLDQTGAADPEPDQDPDPEPKNEPEPDPDPEPEADAAAETEPDQDPDPEPEQEPEPEQKIDIEINANDDNTININIGGESDADPDPERVPDSMEDDSKNP